MPKKVQTTTQLPSSHMLANTENSPSEASTVHELELLDVQLGFRKGRGSRDQIAKILNHRKSSTKTSTSALLTMSKPLTVWITINRGKL